MAVQGGERSRAGVALSVSSVRQSFRVVLMLLVVGLGLVFLASPNVQAQGCVDDGFEFNNDFTNATELTAGQQVQAQVCSGGSSNDYFSIEVLAGDTIDVELLFTHANGDLDIELIGPNQLSIITTQSSSDNEFFNHQAAQSGTYFVRVYGFQDAENSYSLTIAAELDCSALTALASVISTTVADKNALNVAIGCFNAQTPAGEYKVTLTASLNYASGEVVRTIDPGSSATITIDGAGNSLVGPGTSGGLHFVTITGNANVALKRIIIADAESRAIQFVGPLGTVTIDDSLIQNPTHQALFINSGTVTVTNTRITGIGAEGIAASGGSLTFERSLIDDVGTGISQNGGAVNVVNSTISSVGVGVRAFGLVPLTMSNSTITNASTAAVQANLDGSTILTSNLISGACTGPFAAASTANFAADSSCGGSTVFTGTLAPLGNNGCAFFAPLACVPTHALEAGNAVDAGQCGSLTTDQRGDSFPRTIGTNCDVGAFESLVNCAPPYDVDTEAELADAINCYNLAASGATTTVTLTGNIELGQALPVVNNAATGPRPILVIEGGGFTLDANSVGGDAIHITEGDVRVNLLTISGASSDGIEIQHGSLTVTNSTVANNAYGIYASFSGSASVTATNSTIAANGVVGVGHDGSGSVSLTGVTLVDNSWGIGTGGAGSMTLTGSVFARNSEADCSGTPPIDGGGNVIETTCGTIVGTPGLGATLAPSLVANNCITTCTATIALQVDSPAIDAGGSCGLAVDQRGVARPPGRCDAGAFELRLRTLSLTNTVVGIAPLGDWSFGLSAPLACISVNGAAPSQTATITAPAAGGSSSDVVQLHTGCPLTIAETAVAGYSAGAIECAIFGQAPAPATGLAIDDDADCTVTNTRAQRTCAGKLVTIDMNVNGGDGMGTAGDDVILGTSGVDVIDAGAGSDTVCGEGGDDTIDGGVGDFRDFLYGGPGDDTMFGGFGIDYMYGEAGEDTIDGQGGSDRLFGGPDNDLIKGDSGADRMFGGSGDDEMFGMGGQDFMWGEAGNDTMQGTHQSDNMFGGPGNDTMFGAGGKDSLFGEAGNDSLNGGLNTDYLDGGADVDTANGGRGRDKPLTAPQIRASNGQFFGGSGCVAETILNCQPTS